ncbi:MAG: DUF2723 domain-containing protein [Planctomycetota bacterium]|nr:DUF2723 domain-containing protein [Planctomycetota bacterium]
MEVDRPPKPAFREAALVSAALLALYLAGLSPAIGFGDSATFVGKAERLELQAGVLGHPLYTVVSRAFLALPVGTPAARVNLVSAVFAAATGGLLFLMLGVIGLGRAGSLAGTAAFGLSHTLWLKASLADVYTLQMFLSVATWLPLIQWRTDRRLRWLYVWAALWGIAFLHHLLIVFLFPGQLLFLLLEDPGILKRNARQAAAAFGLFIVASSPWWLLVLAWHGQNPGEPVGQLFTGGGGTEAKMFGYSAAEMPRQIALSAGFFAYQFPLLTGILGLIGMAASWRRDRPLFWMLAVSFVINTVFAIGYRESHKYELFLSAYLIFAIWVGFGASALAGRLKPAHRWIIVAIVALTPPLVYAVTPLAIGKRGLPISLRTIPYRDNLRYFLWPPKRGDWAADRYGREALSTAPPRAVILADWTPYAVLEHFTKVEGLRPDVTIAFLERTPLAEILGHHLGDRPIYLADDEPVYGFDAFRDRFRLVQEGVLFRLEAR